MPYPTYTVGATGITFAAGKSMLAVFNGVGSERIVRVYRIFILNNQTAAVTGVLTTFEIRRISSLSGGTSLTFVKHDSINETPPSQIVAATGGTTVPVSGAVFRRLVWSNDEPAVGTGSWDELETIPVLSCVWDAGYGEDDVQPITLREGEGLEVAHTGTTTVGYVDVYFELTVSTS
jgi:hypothetical protein